MIVLFGCDPNAASLLEVLVDHTRAMGHEAVIVGVDDPIYPNTAVAVAEKVRAGQGDRGVLLCGTGIGMSIAANKVPGIACALVHDVYQAGRAQLSNNARLIAMGAQVTGPETAKCLLTEFLAHDYDPSSRSAPKVAAIDAYERALV